MEENNKNLAVPGAIILAGLIIAGAVIFSNGGINLGTILTGTDTDVSEEETLEVDNSPRPVTEDDHIRGNVDAEVVIIEYSDTECPFCKRFHETLGQIVDSYEPNEVAWVYRHFPIPQLHSKAELEAVATECANTLGGNDAFWAYTNRIYEITPSNNGLDIALLPEIAIEVGLDKTDFESCLEDESLLEKVRADRTEAVSVGGRGTPHSVIILKNKLTDSAKKTIEGLQTQLPPNTLVISENEKRMSMSGALPFDLIDTIVSAIIAR